MGRCCHAECPVEDDPEYHGPPVEYVKCVSNESPIDDLEPDEDEDELECGFRFTLCSRCHNSTKFFGKDWFETVRSPPVVDECDTCGKDVLGSKCGKVDGKRICNMCFAAVCHSTTDTISDDEIDWFLNTTEKERSEKTPPAFETFRPVLSAYIAKKDAAEKANTDRVGVAVKRLNRKRVPHANGIVKIIGVDRCLEPISRNEIIRQLYCRGTFDNK